jgi:hypothetical protein
MADMSALPPLSLKTQVLRFVATTAAAQTHLPSTAAATPPCELADLAQRSQTGGSQFSLVAAKPARQRDPTGFACLSPQ